MKKRSRNWYLIITSFFILTLFIQTVGAQEEIIVDFYYSETCGSCIKIINNTIELIEKLYEYDSSVVFQYKPIQNEIYDREHDSYHENYSIRWPFVVVKNDTDITLLEGYDDNLSIKMTDAIDDYIAGSKPNVTYDECVKNIPVLFWNVEINICNLSLPVLTIVLGVLDSFNPCAFFILIFLLNLMIYAQSRRRMLLVGGVFIFFSGLLYYIFMFILFNTFVITQEHVGIVTIIAGVIALTLGVVNIKDFFFFKKGASLSIPDDKKPKLYKQMRNLVKAPRLLAVIIGTIILAATVNFYELLCTLGLPLVFTRQLASNNLPEFQSYLYIFFYNVVYVIPLIIIVLIFIITLGRRKLTEWHGQILKLLTGIMLVSFGVLFLVDYTLLENVVTPIFLLFFSLGVTGIITTIWKKFKKEQDSSN